MAVFEQTEDGDVPAFVRTLARAAMASIPAMLRERTAGIAFTIEEFPSDEILAEMGIESPFDRPGSLQNPKSLV